MSSEIERVRFTLRDPENVFGGISERTIGSWVIDAVLSAVHMPAAAILRGVIVSVVGTAMEIQADIEQMQSTKRQVMQIETARRYSRSLRDLAQDDDWDAEVREILRQSLIKTLSRELEHFQRSA